MALRDMGLIWGSLCNIVFNDSKLFHIKTIQWKGKKHLQWNKFSWIFGTPSITVMCIPFAYNQVMCFTEMTGLMLQFDFPLVLHMPTEYLEHSDHCLELLIMIHASVVYSMTNKMLESLWVRGRKPRICSLGRFKTHCCSSYVSNSRWAQETSDNKI